MTATPPSLGFADISTAMRAEGDGFHAHISDDWRQGRTCYGGLTAGLAVAAAKRRFENLPPLRSVNVNFVGPVSGNPLFTPKLLRQGRNVTMVEVVARVEDDIVGTVTWRFRGGARERIDSGLFSADLPRTE